MFVRAREFVSRSLVMLLSPKSVDSVHRMHPVHGMRHRSRVGNPLLVLLVLACIGTRSVHAECVTPNGFYEVGEECDNDDPAFSCTVECMINTAYGWTGCVNTVGAPSVCYKCGNAILEIGEVCDDGNIITNDGCENDCTVTSFPTGWTCTSVVGQVSVCNNCGNGQIEIGESCDMGNGVASPINFNGGFDKPCKGDCSGLNSGWACNQPYNVDVTETCHKCGNSIVEYSETCDFGASNTPSAPMPLNRASISDGCSSVTCTAHNGYQCGPAQWTTFARTPMFITGERVCQTNLVLVCGDGYRHNYAFQSFVTQEQCDDCNTNNGDGCSSTCMIEPGATCTTDFSPSPPTECTDTCTSQCGNGVLNPGEVCDTALHPLHCAPGCAAALDGSQCGTALWGLSLGQYICEYTPVCGNNVVNSNHLIAENSPLQEECDDNNANNGDGCSAQCKIEYPLVRVNNRFTLPLASGSVRSVTSREFFLSSPNVMDSDISSNRLYVAFVSDVTLNNNGLNVFNADGTAFSPLSAYIYPIGVASCKFTSVRFSTDTVYIFTGIMCTTTLTSSRVFRHHRTNGDLGIAIAPTDTNIGGVIRRGLFLHSSGALVVVKTSTKGSSLSATTGINGIDTSSKLIRITCPTNVGCTTTPFTTSIATFGHVTTLSVSMYDAVPSAADLFGNILFVSGSLTATIMNKLNRMSVLTTTTSPMVCSSPSSSSFPATVRSVQYNYDGSHILLTSTSGVHRVDSGCNGLTPAVTILPMSINVGVWYPIQPAPYNAEVITSGDVSSANDAFQYTIANALTTVLYTHFTSAVLKSIESVRYYRPVVASCGDGYKDANEACDDGNLLNGDGCSSTCTFEINFTCAAPTNDYPTTVCTATCGNTRATSEGCDDGNTVSGDGCSSTCAIESGCSCPVNSVGFVSECTCCGNSMVGAGETCDQGAQNGQPGSGCTSTCQVDTPYWECPDNVCRPVCGDNHVVQGYEACDLGINNGPTTGCDNVNGVCTETFGWRCSYLGCSQCGDGAARHGELCDDRNSINNDGCSSTCEVESGYTCWRPDGSDRSVCFSCGDGIRQGPEGCDLGTALNGAANSGCSSTCTVTPGYRCNGACTLDSPGVFGFTGDNFEVFFRDRATLGLSTVPTVPSTITVTGASFTRVHSIHNGPGRGSQLLISTDTFGRIQVHNMSMSLVPTSLNLLLEINAMRVNGGFLDVHLSYNASLAGYSYQFQDVDPGPLTVFYQFVTVRPPNNAPHPRDLALMYTGGDPDFDLLRSTLSPDGMHAALMFTTSATTPGHVTLRIVTRTHPDAPVQTQSVSVSWTHPTLCPSTTNFDAQWSPDGQFFAISCESSLQVYDVHSISSRVLSYESTAPGGALLRYITWSPRSNKIVVTTADARVVIFDPTDPDTVTPPVTAPISNYNLVVVYRAVFHADGSTFSVFAVDSTTFPPTQTVSVSTFTFASGGAMSGVPVESLPMPSTTTSVQPVSGGAMFLYSPATCGDSVVENAETCDDGNTVNGDGCSNQCKIESGWSCTPYYASHPQTCVYVAAPRCADGRITDGETCDDGNMVDGDGCNSLCLAESSTETCVAGQACTPGHDDDCDGLDSTYDSQTQSCVCGVGRFGPRCRTLCDTQSCPSPRGSCDASVSESEFPGFCRCSDGYYSSNDPFAARCSVQLSSASCSVGTTFDTATGQCLPNIVPSGTCYICHRYNATTTAGFGTVTFATLAAAAAATVPACSEFVYTCQPTQLDTRSIEVSGNNVVITSNSGNSGGGGGSGNDNIGSSGNEFVFGGSLLMTGNNPTVTGAVFVATGGSSSSSSSPSFTIEFDATGSARIESRSIPENRPSSTPPYDNSYGNRATDDMCNSNGLFTRQVLDSFFDIFIEAVYERQSPGAGAALRASPMLSSLYLYNPAVTPAMVMCVMQYMAHRGLAPTFMGRKRPGATAVRGRVRSPFTFNNQIVIGYLNAVEFDLSGGPTAVLTMTNNTFIDIPGTAAHLQNVVASDVYNNHFILCGGDTSSSSGHALFIEGTVPAVPGYHVIAENVVATYRTTIQDNTAAFYLKNMPMGTFTIVNNRAALEGPLPLKGFPHGMVLENLPNPVFTEPTSGLCGPASDVGKEDERCVALANTQVQGTVTYITRTASTVPLPAVADYCNDLCSPTLMTTPDPASASVSYDASSVVYATQLGADPQAVHFRVDFSISHTHAYAIPIVEFVPIDDIRSPRQRTNCASRLPGPAPTWTWNQIFDETVLGNAPRWTTVNVSAILTPTDPLVIAHPGTATYRAEASFTLADLLTCVNYNSIPVLSHAVATNTYSFQMCTAFVGPTNVWNEAEGFIVVHRDCVPISLTVESVGSVLVSLTSALVNFHAEVVRSEFLLINDHLQLTLRTSINSVDGANLKSLRNAMIVGTTGTLLNPVDWTIANPSTNPCDYTTAPGTCIQIWTITSNNAAQTSQELFLGAQHYEFTVYRGNDIAPGVNPVTFTVSLNIERGSSQDILARVGATATVHRTGNYPLSPVYDPVTSSFLYGERAYVHICADLPMGQENDVAIDVLSAVYCTPTFPQYIADYDPLNPDTTGCATIGAGIGTHHGEFYNMDNNAAYAAPGNLDIASVQEHLAGDHLSCTMVSAKVNNWIGDRVETYLQFFLEMRSMLDPENPIIPPAGTTVPTPVPIHNTAHNGASRVSTPITHTSSASTSTSHSTNSTSTSTAAPKKYKTTRMVMRVSLTGDFVVSMVSETADTGNSKSAARARARANGNSGHTHASTSAVHAAFVEIDSPMHVNGVGLRVLCANTNFTYARIENKHYDAKYECIDPSRYTEVPSGTYSWWQSNDVTHHSPVLPHTHSEDDIVDNNQSSGYYWLAGALIFVGVIMILAIIIAATLIVGKRNHAKTVREQTQSSQPRSQYARVSNNDV